MGAFEDRVAAVEARVGEQSVMMEAIRQSVDRLDQRMTALDQRMTAIDNRIDQRFTTLEARLDQRFAAIDQRFTLIDERFVGIVQRFTTLDSGLDRIRSELAHQFHWTMGILVTGFASIAAALISGFFALRP